MPFLKASESSSTLATSSCNALKKLQNMFSIILSNEMILNLKENVIKNFVFTLFLNPHHEL